MIHGLKEKKLKVIPDERGRLMEILRSDDPDFQKFGQVYVTTTYPGVIKAWHLHRKQTDHICCVQGMIKLVVYDSRKDSPTYREINRFMIGIHHPALVRIPPGVYHGWMCVSPEEAVVVNTPTELYNYDNPDEERLDPHGEEIPYDWKRRDG
ncbi:MAG: dTDP-4-dehydrorhamnose 3,5-epimerase family protein [Acidobacteria bacterium]|nr:dTDP-4-dehydrorhamnose 3,5-epimerase family protein [Acidobacteriota bacterium]MCG2815661.1 dTDP-4-dehydrorhamnose 3,5-epimerase family protein [Candidatus Aminicenantes bacterium]MBU1338906.1 dTDP-4-dehydrorhamnose 3,5-epimerase family protein [Acidobacteriota bacterium]MBU1474138.1 dTDP-4-dehydrorhamnose 3,5-epimerase family protein [Acidobacteriota bacterium]MBU4203755.1 dTDP-4-dehydrorhamnose 3,5-epimerase family protein [Acidobacteriota bacterium]